MPQPTLFDTTTDNHGLFSDHFLEERFPRREDVQSLFPEADDKFTEVQALFARYSTEVGGWNEDQTEDHFVQPVLDILGWSRRVESYVQRQGRQGRPDYALFTSEERRAAAAEHAQEDEIRVYDYADAVADAKYWGRSLAPRNLLRSQSRIYSPAC